MPLCHFRERPWTDTRTGFWLLHRTASLVVLGPEATADQFDIAGTIRSTTTARYLNIGTDSTSYKTLTFDNSSRTDAWGLEGDTIITRQGSSLGRSE